MTSMTDAMIADLKASVPDHNYDYDEHDAQWFSDGWSSGVKWARFGLFFAAEQLEILLGDKRGLDGGYRTGLARGLARVVVEMSSDAAVLARAADIVDDYLPAGGDAAAALRAAADLAAE